MAIQYGPALVVRRLTVHVFLNAVPYRQQQPNKLIKAKWHSIPFCPNPSFLEIKFTRLTADFQHSSYLQSPALCSCLDLQHRLLTGPMAANPALGICFTMSNEIRKVEHQLFVVSGHRDPSDRQPLAGSGLTGNTTPQRQPTASRRTHIVHSPGPSAISKPCSIYQLLTLA